MNVATIASKIKKDDKGEQAGLHEIITLIYGDKKVGKSTFAAHYPKPIFINCEDGLRTVQGPDGNRPDHLEVSSWQDILVYSDWIINNKDHGYETVVIDGLNEAWFYLTQHLLDKYTVEHMNEGALAYGKGNALAARMFRQWFQALRKANMAVVLCAHDRIVAFENNGVSYDKRIPFIDTGKNTEAWDTIKPAINMVLYATKVKTKDGVRHVMRTKGTELVEAADPYGHLPELMEFKYDHLLEATNKQQSK